MGISLRPLPPTAPPPTPPPGLSGLSPQSLHCSGQDQWPTPSNHCLLSALPPVCVRPEEQAGSRRLQLNCGSMVRQQQQVTTSHRQLYKVKVSGQTQVTTSPRDSFTKSRSVVRPNRQPTHVTSRPSHVSLTLPLKQFQCRSNRRWHFLVPLL